ncbi:MAG: hypothetical protein WAL72_02445 [Streptosporangiaceae bacterium]
MLMILPAVWALTMLAGPLAAAWTTASCYMTGLRRSLLSRPAVMVTL